MEPTWKPFRTRTYDPDSSLTRYLNEIGRFRTMSREEEQSVASNVRKGVGADGGKEVRGGTGKGGGNGKRGGGSHGHGGGNGRKVRGRNGNRGNGNGKPSGINTLVESNLLFVVKIAREYRNMGVPFEDLLNEGNLGLVEAARRFDHRRGNRFITYAYWWIQKAILRALSRHSRLVPIPVYQQKRIRELRKQERELAASLQRTPRTDELCESLCTSARNLDRLRQINRPAVSLDERVGRERDMPLSEFLPDGKNRNPEEELLRSESARIVDTALRVLTEQEKAIISKRFGLEDGRHATLKEIGDQMGLSRERIRQIEFRARHKILSAVTGPRRRIRSNESRTVATKTPL